MNYPNDAVAIVGMSCRLPGNNQTPEDLWEFISGGGNAIADWPTDRWDSSTFFHPDKDRQGSCYAPGAATISGFEDFDADFFGITPIEASRISPNQRLLLETTWEALERAGIDPTSLKGSDTGVFIGTISDEFGEVQRDNTSSVNGFTNAGGAPSISANRISHAYDFRGPSLIVDTACSSSLVALHMAMKAIKDNECGVAMVGAVNTFFKSGQSVGFSRAGMLSAKAQCQTFDAEADGFVRAEGAAVVCLKKITQAQADGDPILGVVLGTGVNQDGRTQGISLPSGDAQQALLEQVYDRAEVDPASVSYVEAHGTGTRVGDPIECTAIGKVIGQAPNRTTPCLVGSIKGNK